MAACLRAATQNAPRTSLFSKVPRTLTVRRLHTPKPLPYSIEGGLGKFLPPPALQTMVEYQDGLLKRLQDEVRTDPTIESAATVAQTVISYSTRKERTLAFNYAVLALNNSFFLEQLAPLPEFGERADHQDKISIDLLEAIRNNYGDLTRLKSTFSSAALGMFSNGWVWFVTDTAGNLGVLPTFGPSTLLVRSRLNLSPEKIIFREEISSPIPTPISKEPPPGVSPSFPTSGVSSSKPLAPSDSRMMHSRSMSYLGEAASVWDGKSVGAAAKGPASIPDMLNVGKKLYPLFCVPVYEHGWMSAGYGIWGKEPWLREFWSVLDWSKVSSLYQYAKSRTPGKF